MTHIEDLFPARDLLGALDEGLVKVQHHPDLDLSIYNYTAQAQYTPGAWNNPAVRICRGLIVDGKGHVVARPLPKFFNYGQPEAPKVNLERGARVYDKLDGSLGILYPTGRDVLVAGMYAPEYAVATRGSFTSEQALHATEVWNERYQGHWCPLKRHTALFEIVYPDNRIVVNYGDQDDLILLGVVSNAEGIFLGPEFEHWTPWPGPRAERLPHKSLAEALLAPPRENAEGFVVHTQGAILKVKQEDYVRLHRIVTGLSERTVWEHLAEDKPLTELLSQLPDELHEWTMRVARQLLSRYSGLAGEAMSEFDRLTDELSEDIGPGWERKDFALRAKDSPRSALLFRLLDGRPLRDVIWKQLKPKGDTRPFAQLEEAA